MPFSPGDIVHFDSAVAGKMKFHLCLCVEFENEVHSFIFLNSEGGFRDQFVTDCDRLPNMPESRTGKTVFDCPTVHRKTTAQLASLRPTVRCRLPKAVALEFIDFAKRITSMTPHDHGRLITMLQSLIDE
ncbi:MAG: hypothetical protein ACTHKQ_24775 [Mesorhizobium sp.]